MIDSHCHLDHEPLFSDLKNVIQRSKEIGVKKLFDEGLSACMVTADPKGDIAPLYLKDVEDEQGKIKPRLVNMDSQKANLVFDNSLQYIEEADYEAAKAYVENPADYDFKKILAW